MKTIQSCSFRLSNPDYITICAEFSGIRCTGRIHKNATLNFDADNQGRWLVHFDIDDTTRFCKPMKDDGEFIANGYIWTI